MKEQVVQAEVAVHKAGLVFRRKMARKPVRQGCQRRIAVRTGFFALARPAAHLPCDVVSAFAIVGEAYLVIVHPMQGGDHAIHFPINRRAFCARQAGQRLVEHHPALQELHDVEGAAQDRRILAVEEEPRDGYFAALQGTHHAIFAVNGMGGR